MSQIILKKSLESHIEKQTNQEDENGSLNELKTKYKCIRFMIESSINF